MSDPRQEPDLATDRIIREAVERLPFAPRTVHDPVHPIEGDPGGTTHDIVFCPDCLEPVISPLDAEFERVGMRFRICWDLHGRELPADLRPCHATCLIACGRRSKLTATS